MSEDGIDRETIEVALGSAADVVVYRELARADWQRNMDAFIVSLCAQVRRLQEAEAASEQLCLLAANNQQRLDALLSSNSWKLTRPLRALKRVKDRVILTLDSVMIDAKRRSKK